MTSFFVSAQNSELKGTVYSADSIAVLIGISVGLDKTSFSTLTNSDGNYSFRNLSAGEYNLVIIHPGYKKIRITLSLKDNELDPIIIPKCERWLVQVLFMKMN